MRIDHRPACTCRSSTHQRSSSLAGNTVAPLRLPDKEVVVKSVSTPDLLRTCYQRFQQQQQQQRSFKSITGSPDHVPADGQFSSGRRRWQSLDGLKPPVPMSTGWLDDDQSAALRPQAIGGGGGSPSSSQMQRQEEEPAQTRVCTSLSWDSGYNECASTDPADRFSPSGQQHPPAAMRMPSVIVSDCSDDRTIENGVANGYHHHRLEELPSPTLSSHSSSGHEMDPSENSQSWGWSSSYRRTSASNGFLILPGQGSIDDDATTISSSLLSVRRLSDCSSCSSLATLDMEPCCSGPCSAHASSTSFQGVLDQSFPLAYDLTEDAVEEADSPADQQDDANLRPSDEANPSAKVSAWRKVRSAVQWSPFVQTFRRQRYPWVQLAGHQGNFKLGGERGTILKKLSPKEESCFQQLMQDPLRSFIPSYKGNVTSDDGEKFLVLEDLLGDFRNPSVMDCKLGVRTYLEDELAKAKLKPKLRKDMFEKMLQVDPNAPTPDELRSGGVTKPRYMVWRETISSTASLGFRIEGIRKQDGSSTKDFKTVGSSQQILEVLNDFVKDHPHALVQYMERLKELTNALEGSEFFATHELIGTSLLFVHDQNKANIWMIDFAKTHRLPAGIQIDHRSPWNVGNHEDGYLIGLANLSSLLGQLRVGGQTSVKLPDSNEEKTQF